MISGKVTLETFDLKTGKILQKKVIKNSFTTVGLEVFWKFMIGPAIDVGDRIVGLSSKLLIESVNEQNQYSVETMIPFSDSSGLLEAALTWVWLDTAVATAYIPSQLSFARDGFHIADEGILAQITRVDDDDWPEKEAGSGLRITWETSIASQTGAGGGSPESLVQAGLSEFLRPVIENVPPPLTLGALSGKLFNSEGLPIEPLNPVITAPLQFSGFKTAGDDVPAFSVKTSAIQEQLGNQTPFEAVGLEVSITLGGNEPLLFFKEAFDDPVPISSGSNYTKNFIIGLRNVAAI